MIKRGKKYKEIAQKAQKNSALKMEAAVTQAKKNSYSKFVATMNLHLAIEVPKDREAKSIKGSIALPYPIGKAVKIAVFTTPERVEEAKTAGADMAGLEDLMKDIKAGNIGFDIAIATPDVMPKIAVLGKELGPKGLMPNPKNGTVTTDIKSAVSEYKKGKMNFACDDTGVIHFVVGKADMEDSKIIENINACIAKAVEILGKPYNQFKKSLYIAPTMGPGVKILFEE